jgi:hypothetical protein
MGYSGIDAAAEARSMEIGKRNHLMHSHMTRRKTEQIPEAREMTAQQKFA